MNVLDRLGEQGRRMDAQGRRLDSQDEMLDEHGRRLTAAEVALIELKTTAKIVGGVVIVAVPVLTAVLLKVVGG